MFEKLGGDEGLRTLADKLMQKSCADKEFEPYFKNVDIEMFKEKFRLYVGYLTGGYKYWIGKSLTEAHRSMDINDQLFDQFVSLCVQSLKEMRVKHDCLKETVRALQSLRDQIVIKPQELP